MTHKPFAILALTPVLALLWLSMPPISAAGLPPSPEAELIANATRIFQRAVDTPAAAIPAAVLQQARAIAVIPGALEEAGPFYGPGIVSARGADSMDWTAPAAVSFQGEIPFRLDWDRMDFVLVALTPNGVEYLKRAQASLTGADVIVPGPLGQDTHVKMPVDLIAYAEFGDEFFAGITIREFSIREMKDANARMYGSSYSTADVFRGGFRIPAFAQVWRDALASYFREMS